MTAESVIYEQPANELVRVSLRLEQLLTQLDDHLKDGKISHTRDTMRLLIDTVNLLDRPDIKSKFTQEYHRLIKVFSKLHASPEISQSVLTQTLTDLNELLKYFTQTQGKIAQNLRDDPFISKIRSHLITAGGGCCFDIPIYYHWLQQTPETHYQIISDWMKEFDQVRRAVTLLLNIVRHSAEPKTATAESGYYHDSLNPQPANQMVRITLPKDTTLYPKVSVGKHRMNVRFLQVNQTQTETSVPFELTVCSI